METPPIYFIPPKQNDDPMATMRLWENEMPHEFRSYAEAKETGMEEMEWLTEELKVSLKVRPFGDSSHGNRSNLLCLSL